MGKYFAEGRLFLLNRVFFFCTNVLNFVIHVQDCSQPVSHYPILVLGNKCDLVERRVVSRESGEMLASSLSAAFFEVSAKTGENIDKVCNSCNCNCIHTSFFIPVLFNAR